MRNKYLLSLLAALGFSGCGNNNEIWDEPCYYGPGPDWTPDIIISSQVQNEEKENIIFTLAIHIKKGSGKSAKTF